MAREDIYRYSGFVNERVEAVVKLRAEIDERMREAREYVDARFEHIMVKYLE